MKCLVVLFGIYLLGWSVHAQHSLDKFLEKPSGKIRSEGSVDSGVGRAINEADSDLQQRVSQTDRTLKAVAGVAEKADEGRACKSNCYEVTESSPSRSSVRCLVGQHSKNMKTILIFSGGSVYSVDGIKFTHFDKAARFACGL